MSENERETLKRQIHYLRRSYAVRLAKTVAQMRTAWDDLSRASWSDGTLIELGRLASDLAGSAETFGYPEVGARASEVARLADVLGKGGGAPAGAPVHEEMDRRLRELADILPVGPDDADGGSAVPMSFPRRPKGARGGGGSSERRPVVLAGDDGAISADLLRELAIFGYTPRVLPRGASLAGALSESRPAAIILDVASAALGSTSDGLLAALPRGDRSSLPPIVVLAARDDAHARLAAARAGASAFFARGADPGRVAQRLDVLTGPGATQPYRVLVIEEDPALAESEARTLDATGMRPVVARTPFESPALLEELRPDVILMGLEMHGASGPDLTAALRQADSGLAVPVIFLAEHGDDLHRNEALSADGDGILTRPVAPEHLVATVAAAARRARAVQALLARDALTDLINHARLTELLVSESARSMRQKTRLAFAIVDVDGLDVLNARHGHESGDRVLRALAGMVRRKLRPTDIVGRYGDDEIGVILTETGPASAFLVFERLRAAFAALRHGPDGGSPVTATFTCGIATLPHCWDAVKLWRGAEKALHEAKRAGPDRLSLVEY